MSFIRKIKTGKKVYFAEVKNKRIDGKVVQRHIRYLGKEPDNQTILSTSISELSIDKVKLSGPLLVLNHLANEIKLPSILGEFGPEILSLVYAHGLDYKSLNQMSRWFERTDLNRLLNLESLTESKLLMTLDFLESKEIETLQKDIFENVKKFYKLSSKVNLHDIKKILKGDVLCGLSLNPSLKQTLRSIIKTEKIVQYSNRIRLKNAIFYVIEQPYTHGEINGKIAISFNEQLKKDLKESRYDDISNAKKLLMEEKEIKTGLNSLFDKNGNILVEELEKREEFEGYFCLFTTKASISKFDMVSIYFDKDLIEKAFRSLKGVIKLRPIRHWLHNRVIAHVLICFLAYLLLSLLKYRLRKIDISPTEALQEIDSIYKVYLKANKNNFKFSRIVTLNKKQEKILNTIVQDLIA